MATLASPGVSATARSRPDVTDHDLVEAVRAGDDHAFERLYHRYHRRISAYIFGMVHDHGRAEDVTQEVFVSALRRMRQTDRPIVFKPWIYEIAKNACIDQFRRTSRAEEVSIDAQDGSGLSGADHGKLHATGLTPDAAVESKQQLADLQGAFGGLSDAHHQILVMRELEGLSYREIGERLGMSRPAVESTLFRARRRLTEEYQELRTGERCVRIQGIIESADAGRLGIRDQRRVSSHITHCQPCRKHAVMAGLDAGVLARRPVRARIAAFLPLPAFLKRWIDPATGGADAAGGHLALAQASTVVGQHGDAMAGWMKAGAVAAAVALAGVGTGAVEHVAGGGGAKRPGDAAAAQATPAAKTRAAGDPSGGAATGGAVTGAAATGGSTGHRPGGGASGTRASQARGTASHTSSAGLGTTSGPAGAADGSGHPRKDFSGDRSTGAGAGSGAGDTSGGGADARETAASSAKGGASSSGKTGSGTSTTTVTQPVQSATTTATAPVTGSTQPLVDPNLGALTGGGTTQAPPQSVGGAVSGATDAVGDTVGGQVGDTVKGTGQAVGNTVDQAVSAVGSLLGGKKTQ
ncbi:MAG TPA: sigma-70 family RNA polymerase sigma factor [Baekduia sp.]|uniref:RNA polymerase sigma factor n=1 Tax=Baekduia sp. TaxID=2600305 RepID=UPI002D782713|nr:sigma-70 family RNA polymerase sigma factor [Baekduia sp.]HET6510040.1 sigma-70 family RNA polymerase sigma factor [Baekduia sp.]